MLDMAYMQVFNSNADHIFVIIMSIIVVAHVGALFGDIWWIIATYNPFSKHVTHMLYGIQF